MPVLRPDEQDWQTRPHEPGEGARHYTDLSEPLGVEQLRTRIWRYEPGARGPRHRHPAQEETFVVVSGTATFFIGEPPERHDVPAGGAAHVPAGTPVQVANLTDEVVVHVASGAPADGRAEFLDSAL